MLGPLEFMQRAYPRMYAWARHLINPRLLVAALR
jgi:hypothetical protein